MLSILIWWAAPVVAAALAASVISLSRRVRESRGDVETLEGYQRAREALARSAQGGIAARARQE